MLYLGEQMDATGMYVSSWEIGSARTRVSRTTLIC
jgi:hypothetical protein